LHTGEEISLHGTHYEVQDARIYTRPEDPVPIYVSGLGRQSAKLAGRTGDGYCLTKPGAELVHTFRDAGGGDEPVQGGTKVSWDRDPNAALKAVHRLWGNVALPGQFAQTLPTPEDFAAAMTLVTPEMVGKTITCGPDSDRHATRIRSYLDAGIDEVYVHQIGPDMDGFFAAYEREVLPQLRH
jgi:G6PDH family F420-dependent oxidoreductase